MSFITKAKSLKYFHVLRNKSKLDIFVGTLVSEKTTISLHFRLNVNTSFGFSYWTKRWRHYDVALLTGRNIMHNSNVPTVAKVYNHINLIFSVS